MVNTRERDPRSLDTFQETLRVAQGIHGLAVSRDGGTSRAAKSFAHLPLAAWSFGNVLARSDEGGVLLAEHLGEQKMMARAHGSCVANGLRWKRSVFVLDFH